LSFEKRKKKRKKKTLTQIFIGKLQDFGETPFWIACNNGHFEIVKLLLNDEKVIDINKENDYGWTPFYIACQNLHIKIVEYIVKLLESFESIPNETRTKLRIKFGFAGK